MNQPTVHNGGVNRGEGPFPMLLAIVTGCRCPFWYRSYNPHMSRNSASPVCEIFIRRINTLKKMAKKNLLKLTNLLFYSRFAMCVSREEERLDTLSPHHRCNDCRECKWYFTCMVKARDADR